MHTITKLRMLQFPKVAATGLAKAANMATKVRMKIISIHNTNVYIITHVSL